jgi:diketogulonate reductase-like aldo/keto reductase
LTGLTRSELFFFTQAITRHARHDNIKKRLERQLKELEEREKERKEKEM